MKMKARATLANNATGIVYENKQINAVGTAVPKMSRSDFQAISYC